MRIGKERKKKLASLDTTERQLKCKRERVHGRGKDPKEARRHNPPEYGESRRPGRAFFGNGGGKK